MDAPPHSGPEGQPVPSTDRSRSVINIEDAVPDASESGSHGATRVPPAMEGAPEQQTANATGPAIQTLPVPPPAAAPTLKAPLPPGPMFPECTTGIRVLQMFSLILVGGLTAATFWLVPSLSQTIFDLTGSGDPAPVGIGAVLLGMLYTIIVAFLLPANPLADGIFRRWLLILGGFIVLLVTLVYSSIEWTILFFQWQILLFSGAIMTFGVLRGRRWAVLIGAMLQMFEALGATTGPEAIYTLLGYGILFSATLELSYSSAWFAVVLARELAEADGPKTKALARSALDRGAGSYAPRLLVCLLAAALLLGTGTALFLRPGTFGPAYAESLESSSVLAFTLPMLLIILVTVILLGIPDNAGERLGRAGRRTHNSLCIFGAYLKRKFKGTPDEESPKGFESWQTDDDGAELETF